MTRDRFRHDLDNLTRALDDALASARKAADAVRWVWISGRQVSLEGTRGPCVHGRAQDDRCEGCGIAFRRGDTPK